MRWQQIRYRVTSAVKQFMYGRNGVDEIAWLILGLSLIISLIAQITGNVVLMLLYYVGFVFCIMRIFSRDLVKRQQENRVLKSRLQIWKNKSKNRSIYRYLKCPACKQQLRVPRGKGKIEITCSKCYHKWIKKV